MYRDLIINLAIVISFLAISGQVFKNNPMSSSVTQKLIGGIIGGILGITLMFFSIQVTDTTIMDLRNFVIIVVTLYGGIISGLLAGLIVALGRVLLFGLNISSITAVITLIILVIICGLISKSNLATFKKYIFMNFSNIIIIYIAFIYLLNNTEILFDILLYYGLISIVGGLIIYYICDYIVRSNENFRKLKEYSQIDFLTGLNNVRQYDAIWNTHVLNAKERNERLSLLLIDIDHFKNINDTYGHPIGDIVLKELSHVLKNSTRSFDTISRNGGEEFSVILPDCPNHQAIEIAERIRNAVAKHDFFISELNKINITVSIGIATFPETVEDADKMIEKADSCLYKAKNSGSNQVCSSI
jgi:diguanylate cyclase